MLLCVKRGYWENKFGLDKIPKLHLAQTHFPNALLIGQIYRFYLTATKLKLETPSFVVSSPLKPTFL